MMIAVILTLTLSAIAIFITDVRAYGRGYKDAEDNKNINGFVKYWRKK